MWMAEGQVRSMLADRSDGLLAAGKRSRSGESWPGDAGNDEDGKDGHQDTGRRIRGSRVVLEAVVKRGRQEVVRLRMREDAHPALTMTRVERRGNEKSEFQLILQDSG